MTRRPAPRHPVTEALKGRRLALGLTQRELAARSDGLRQAEVSGWETGKVDPSLANLNRWAEALGCEIIAVEAEE